ncbi:MAG: type II secretion system protein GspD [Gammaproteobacteria bacterium]|nr:MAG: type II secretion system protein GspD [Gammaproteobacteria bacterium]
MSFYFISHRGKLLKSAMLGLITALLIQSYAWADQITLNLKDADIRALISTVSKFTGKNFIIDPRVKAKVTVVSAKTMSEDEVYEVFLSILQVHGYAAVPVGNVVKIVPEVDAKQGPVPFTKGSRDKGDTLITQVLTLDHIPAAQLVPILRPLVPQQGHLAAYNPTNTLIITDYAANISRLQKIIRDIDKPESDELEIIPLQHASATELVRILNALYAKGGAAGAPAPSTLTLAADERTNSILMSGERADRIKTRATIAHLDTPLAENADNTHVIYLKYAKADDIVKVLTGVQKSQATAQGKAAPVAAPQATNNITADIQSDEATNAIIITAGPDVVRRMKSIISQLDIRRAQVLVESIIAEISTNRAKELGSQFAIAGREGATGSVPIGVSNFGGTNGIIGLLGAADTGNVSDAVGAIGNGLTLGVGSDSGTRFAFLLKALNSDAATNILSTPSIVTLDNQEAEISVGQNVPFLTGSYSTTNNGTTNPFQTVERKDIGITLKVTPQINDGDTIKLDIDQEISQVAASSQSTVDLTTNKRTLKTSVLVEDGEILVLGGLIDDQMRDSTQKVPLLGDIPLLGVLFRSQNTTKDKQNLMIFMRPSILRDKADAMYHTSEKYNYLRAQQIQAGEEGFGLLHEDTTPLLPPLDNLGTPENKPESRLEPVEQDIKQKQHKTKAGEDDWIGYDSFL